MLIREDLGWNGRANFAGKLFDSVHLIPLQGLFQRFSSDFVHLYTYVACFRVAMWFVFVLCSLIVFMVYWATSYSEPFQTSKMEFFVKIVTSNQITSLLRRWKRFCIQHLNMLNVNCLARFCYIYVVVYFIFEITCICCHFSTIRFPFETLGI